MSPISATCSTRGSDRRLRASFAVVALALAPLLTTSSARAEDPCSGPAAKHVFAPSADTLLAVAICHEAHGKNASAWAEYLEAAGLAHRARQSALAKVALSHASSVERRLAKLTVRVAPEADVPSLRVRRDGIALDRAAWSTALPVDPGEHVVEAWADGKAPYRVAVTIHREREAQVVIVGPLADSQDEPVATTTLTSATLDVVAAPPPSDDDRGDGTAQRAIGVVLAGAGLAAAGVGGWLGYEAIQRRDAARSACPSSACSDPAALADNDRAKEMATLSTVTLAAGGAVTLLGAILFFTAPSSRSPRAAVLAAPGYAGIGMSGALP